MTVLAIVIVTAILVLGMTKRSKERSRRSPRKQFESITVSPDLSKNARKILEESWMKSVPRYLQAWTPEDIRALRTLILETVNAGIRAESIVETIQQTHGVSDEEAQFLAHQEIRVLTSRMKALRYVEAGVMKYRWACVKGSPQYPVRPMHKALEGKVFTWDNPPLANERGERLHPGEDEGCRCTAIPVVEF